MALTKTIANPYGAPGETIEGYFWIADAHFDFASGRGRVIFHVHTSEAASTVAPPVRVLILDLPPGGRPAITDAAGDEIAAAVPPFNELMYANRDVITALATAMYELALAAVPEVVGATVVPLQEITSP